jgi:hypothetical protein
MDFATGRVSHPKGNEANCLTTVAKVGGVGAQNLNKGVEAGWF